MILLIIISTYILSVIGLLLFIYIMDTSCKTIGDILDESEFFMYIPFINTAALISVIIEGIICIVIKLLDKIRNIKLR